MNTADADAAEAARFAPARVQVATQAVVAATGGVEWITDGRVARLSQDFYWFSPVLTRELQGWRADAVARPVDEAQIRAVVAACARHEVPITVRGSGTGNYGQCMPVYGGVILDLSAYRQLVWHRDGAARAQAGIRLIEMDRATPGWELRCVPSTFRSATLGGLYGGGFGGIGSINFGPLASTGNVLGVRAISVEVEPQCVELRAPEALLLHHVYGTNGIVLELEVALAPAHAWFEAIVAFESFDAAIEFADALAHAPGIVKKSVTLLADPIPDLLLAATPLLKGTMPSGCHAVFVAAAEPSADGFDQLTREFGGTTSHRQDAQALKRSQRTILEFTWNHTTLHALKVDKTLTYIQSGFDAGRHVQQAKALRAALGDEVLVHLEFIRNKEGAMGCSGLQLVRYSSDERLNQIMQIHRDAGVYIANPHVWRVEDGKQGAINADVVMMKRRFDPLGLLNPGKLRGWAERERIAAGAGSGLATLPRF